MGVILTEAVLQAEGRACPEPVKGISDADRQYVHEA